MVEQHGTIDRRTLLKLLGTAGASATAVSAVGRHSVRLHLPTPQAYYRRALTPSRFMSATTSSRIWTAGWPHRVGHRMHPA